MEGLNITIFNYKEIFIDNIEFRIDAEYYQKEYLDIYEKLQGSKTLNELVYMSDVSSNGAFAYVHDILNDDNPKTVPYIRSGNVGGTFINTNELELISEQAHQQLPKSTTKLHDVMMARKGKIGGASIITEDEVNFNCNENVIKLTIHNNEYNPFYFTTFFNSKFGLKQVERISTGNVQPWVSIFQIKKLLIPKLELSLQQEIENIIRKSHNAITIAKQKYTEAETLLLENLGLTNFQAACKPVNIKSLKESFLKTGRLDAEFYQSKYEQYWDLIQSQDYVLIRDEYLHITEKPDWENQVYQYIEIGDVNIGDGSYQANWIETQNLPANAKIQAQKGDILISTVRPYRGAVTIIGENDQDLVVSGAFTVLRKKPNSVFNNEVLKVLLRSDLYKDWLLQFNVGTSYPVIKDEDILNLPIPKIDKHTQTQIANYVRQSNELREQATQLLAQAKYSVEAEIEQSALQERERERERELLDESDYYLRLSEWVLLESLLLGQPKNISVQSFSQSFGISGRLDAEYYQPKFERLLQKLKQYRHKTLGELVDLQKSVEAGSENYRDEGLPFVRVADFSKFGISQTDKFVSPADFADIIRPKKDTILLSKDGTVGIAYCVPSDLEVITSGAIVHLSLKTDEILPDYLALVLNSEAVQLQAQRDAGGSIIQHWKPSEILEVVIPVLPKEIQQVISDKVQMSFELKNQSEILLEQAKILVENEIENGMHATP
ncbi:restriction endonuclease subunit S [Moraxella bovis]|uniref:restriction endonuclease subunit S n=1 Tax=Moraxella bovis TaxID=476 RepID=UPI0022272731|nr:restriction endonuclease subunit S [Moraxella bovis]UZA06639.1 restriction endonuclease subunit S [Moraxella bovis]UZA60154.1 restriction endonuclease subunit S [Moraxella bovis]